MLAVQCGNAVSAPSTSVPGVYEGEVLSWLALADAAAAAIRAGHKPPPVPTRVISQDQLQHWARGVVWDCHDPASCKPVQRSTRHTTFPGERQLDRAAVRRIAAALGWHDDDIVDQIGEGGVEVRLECSIDIVLAFHHDSLLHEIPTRLCVSGVSGERHARVGASLQPAHAGATSHSSEGGACKGYALLSTPSSRGSRHGSPLATRCGRVARTHHDHTAEKRGMDADRSLRRLREGSALERSAF